MSEPECIVQLSACRW